jgi:inositol hexakisphosphate/diphosphoinositol-pentakisphosphate kinase
MSGRAKVDRQLEEFNHMQLAVTTTSRIYKITGKLRVAALERKWTENYVFGHIPQRADISAFRTFFSELCQETNSRHGVMLRNDTNMIERLFYIFDIHESGFVDMRQVIVTFTALSSGSLEERLRFSFLTMDNARAGKLSIADMVTLVRGFINHGANLSIGESLGMVEQFGSDVVTYKSHVNDERVARMQKKIGSTGASLVLTKTERMNLLVPYGIFSDQRITTCVVSWAMVAGDEKKKHISLENFIDLVTMKPGSAFAALLPDDAKALSSCIADFAEHCNPYAIEYDDELSTSGASATTGAPLDAVGTTKDDDASSSLKEKKKSKRMEEEEAERDIEDAEAAEATRKIVLGVCAMDKKAKSKAMHEILHRLPEKEFEVIVFGDDCIFNKDVEDWPIVDCLISFYSTNFPLEKAKQYVKLREPWCCNNLGSEHVLRDRRAVYEHLQKNHIKTPFHIFCSRDGYGGAPPPTVSEKENYITVNGVKINKPFVEKPVDGEDHNIYVYYSSKTGGGSKRLFRKVNNRSSAFYPHENTIRRKGSYIYEEFLSTGGTDIKVYTCGPSYVHAEARKAPTLDGIVIRDIHNKEQRFPISLNPQEKLIARKVVLAFGMRFCGFDILKSKNKSFVCDVNGFSFVKTSKKYYDDAATMLREMMTRFMGRHLDRKVSISGLPPLPVVGETGVSPLLAPSASQALAPPLPPSPLARTSDHPTPADASAEAFALGEEFPGGGGVTRDRTASSFNEPDASGENMELRCVIGIFRHGDRTPKEKLKLKTDNALWIALHKQHASSPRDELKLKSSSELKSVLKTATKIIEQLKQSTAREQVEEQDNEDDDEIDIEKRIQILEHLIRALSRGGSFSGINRKVQIKPLKWCPMADRPTASPATSPTKRSLKAGEFEALGPSTVLQRDISIVDYSAAAPVSRPSSGMSEVSPTRPGESRGGGGLPSEEVTQLEVIVKWGGVLTSRGRKQAERLGEWCRHQLYPNDKGEEDEGLLRLHSTFRHDLKIYSSDEGRVVTTAAAFAKGFLKLEGELPPIITSLVRSDDSVTQLLDDSSAASKHMKMVKKRLHKEFLKDNPSKLEALAPTNAASVTNALNFLGDVSAAMKRLAWLIKGLIAGLKVVSTTLIHRRRSTGSLDSDLLRQAAIAAEQAAMANDRREKDEDEDEVTPIEYNIEEWGEELPLIIMRWEKLQNDLAKKTAKDGSIKWDISKIPDVYDCIKYDVLHNHAVVLDIEGVPELYVLAKRLADVVIPQEYGLTGAEKLGIGAKICQRLLRKIMSDLAAAANMATEFKHETVHRLDPQYMSETNIKSFHRHVRTRLYFTSESHVHAVLNVLRFGAMVDTLVGQEGSESDGGGGLATPLPAGGLRDLSPEAKDFLSNAAELNYLTHIVIRLYENMDDGDDGDDDEEEEGPLDEEEEEEGPSDEEGELDHDRLFRGLSDGSDDLKGMVDEEEGEEGEEEEEEDELSKRYRIEISFSSGMCAVPIEAKMLDARKENRLEEVILAQNVVHKYRVKVWRDKLDHTLPVESLVIVQDLTFGEFQNMAQGVLSRVKQSEMGHAWAQRPKVEKKKKTESGRRTPSRRSSRTKMSRPGTPKQQLSPVGDKGGDAAKSVGNSSFDGDIPMF